MQCSNCGAQLRPGVAFCTSCGAPASAPTPVNACPNCGQPQRPGATFCTYCGTFSKETQAPAVEQRPYQAPVVEQRPYQAPVPPQQRPVEMTPAKKTKARKTPGPGGRIVLRLASVLICLLLAVSLLVTAVVLDLRRITSEKHLQKTVEQILTPKDMADLSVGRLAVMGLDAEDTSYEVEISPDISTDELVDMVYDALKEEYGDQLTVTKGQLKRFYEESTLKERVSEKVAAYVTDVIQGTDDAQITKRDIIDVIDENEDLIQEVFHVRVNAALRQEVLSFVNVEELNDTIRTQVIQEVQEADLGGVSVKELMQTLQGWTSDGVMWVMILVDILLIGLLFLTNWGRVAPALRCASIPMIVVGALLALPTLLAQLLLSGDSIVNVLASSLLGVIAPVHYIMLALGVLLLIGSFVVKIFVKLAEE